MSKNIIIGNWKMNVGSVEDAKKIAKLSRALAAKMRTTEVVICPPFSLIAPAAPAKKAKNFHMGAQSASVHEGGSHTGDVGVNTLKSLGVSYVLAGHSEQRVAGDTNATVSQRAQRILAAGLTAVICVGEKARQEGGEHLDELRTQIRETLASIPQEQAKNIIVAYEPVWAIGAKEAMQPDQIYEMSLFVKKVFSDVFGPEAGLKVRVLYGGTANATNAAEIMRVGKVNGLLVGRESVNAGGLTDMLKAVDTVR